ncbi:MAG: hypothetical protein JSR31_04450 [Nitrospira sp.]|nr:hypothetical protein [Nitrospira sp.]
MMPSSRRTARLILCCAMMGTSFTPLLLSESLAEESSEPKSIRMTCGKCPDGYATTGVTESQEICKDSDGVLVQCVPLGANMLGVCGVCPDGYAEVGSSSLPARCGNDGGGRLTQCQLKRMESHFPDSTQGYKSCPPDCGSAAQPGHGALPPPPKYQTK